MLSGTIGGVNAQELVYWSVWTEPEPQAVVLKQIFDKYAEEHPGVTIRSVWNGRQNLVQMRSYLAAGNKVDIIDGDARQYLGLMLKEDLALDISDLANDLGEVTLPPHTLSLMRENDIQYGPTSTMPWSSCTARRHSRRPASPARRRPWTSCSRPAMP